jgi:tetratricopeptide (TPR) repeat protein
MHQTALAACERANDVTGQSHMLHGIALAYARSGRFEEAGPFLDRAWALGEQTGDLILRGRICSSWSWFAERRGDGASSLKHAEHAQRLYREAGFRWGEAEALGDTGWSLTQVGEYEAALDCCERALVMLEGLNHVESKAAIADSLGHILLRLGKLVEASAWCQRSVDTYREFGDRYNEGRGMGLLGDIHLAAGDGVAARAAWQQALAILDDLDHPDAEEIRAKLDA